MSEEEKPIDGSFKKELLVSISICRKFFQFSSFLSENLAGEFFIYSPNTKTTTKERIVNPIIILFASALEISFLVSMNILFNF